MRRLFLKAITSLGFGATSNGSPVIHLSSEPLDLGRHRPEEFTGKTVTIEGREYQIAALIRQSANGYLHQLINRLSGLCLHAIQIRPEYVTSPESAREISLEKAKSEKAFRAAAKSTNPSIAVSFLTVKDAHGGSFEVHEYHDGRGWLFGKELSQLAQEDIRESHTFIKNANYEEAMTRLQRTLKQYPNHTQALHLLALCQCAENAFPAAEITCAKIIEIEPNLAFYRAMHINVALKGNRRFNAARFFDDLRERYPNLSDFNVVGAHAYLAIGEPERAKALLESTKISLQEEAELRSTVDAAIDATKRYLLIDKSRFALIERKKTGQPTQSTVVDKDLLDLLGKMNASYPVNPFIQANLGFALRAVGDNKRAVELIISGSGGLPDKLVPLCWANAAYCAIQLSEWKVAMNLLKITMSHLSRSLNGNIKPADVPGIVTWIFRSGIVQETLSPSASEMLDKAINDCPDKSLVAPEVHRMATLLRQFRDSARRR